MRLNTSLVAAALATALALPATIAHAGSFCFFFKQNSNQLVLVLAGVTPPATAAQFNLKVQSKKLQLSYQTNPAAWTMSYQRWLMVNGVSDVRVRSAMVRVRLGQR